MKKTVFIIFAAVALASGSCGSSGSGRTDRMLDDYESICKEMVEATRDNDVKRINEIQEKVRKFQDKYSDFEEKDMTPQQKERFKEITTEMIGAAMENAMQDTGYTSGTAD